MNDILIWDLLTCPLCGAQVPLKLMSLIARCPCGTWFEDVSDPARHGWHQPEPQNAENLR